MLAQSFELNSLGLSIVAVLKEALGLFLSESLLVFKLHELFVLRSRCVGQIASILRDCRRDSLQARSRRWRRQKLPSVLFRMQVSLLFDNDAIVFEASIGVCNVDVFDDGCLGVVPGTSTSWLLAVILIA